MRQPARRPIAVHVTRQARFVGEFALAAVASGLVATALEAGATPATPYPIQQANSWLLQLTRLYLEWLVMRRYFGWASQWTLASLAGRVFAGLTTPLTMWLNPLVGPQLAWLPARMLLTTPQAVVLSTRARMPWLWPVVQAVLGVTVSYVVGQGRTASAQEYTWVLLVNRVLTVVSAVVGAAVLAWMCRDELERHTERPPAETSTRLEFLIGWVAVHAAVIAILSATPTQSTGPVRGVQLGVALYGVAYLAGIAFVLSTTKEDWKAWSYAPAMVAGAWLVVSLTPLLFLVYYPLLRTKWTALGLTLALAQWSAIRRWSGGGWWLAAAVVGWSASQWLPASVAAVVGPGQLYRYPIAESAGIYAIVGLLTGLAVIYELRNGKVFAG